MNLLRSPLVRWLRPGIAETLDRTDEFRRAWDEQNVSALEREGPLWSALGDSTAQGLGASAYDRGYVGQLRGVLEREDGRTWRVLNVSRSGARTGAIIREQLVWLERLVQPPDLVTCSVGANDVIRPWAGSSARDTGELIA